MIRSILLALDGSRPSEVAEEVALDLACETNATLVGLGVLDRPAICAPQPVPIGAGSFKDQRDAALLEDAQVKIDSFLSKFRTDCSGTLEKFQTLCRDGSPAEEIGFEAQRHDLIVISTETHFHFETRLDSGETLRVLSRTSPRPILAVPPKAKRGQGILIAYDGSAPAARAVQLMHALGLARGKKITCVTHHRKKERGEFVNNLAVDFLRDRDYQVKRFIFTGSRSPSEEIVAVAESMQPQMLVLGSFGHTGLKEKLFGSTTRKLLFGSVLESVPIFLFH